MIINYNDMLMMLWNLPENEAVFADFTIWDKNEDNLIKRAKKDNKKIILINKELNNFKYVLPINGIEKKAKTFGADLVVWHAFNNQFNYGPILNNLNCKKAYVLSNNPDLDLIKKAFGEKNTIVVEHDSKLNDKINESELFLKTGQIEKYKNLNGFNYTFKGFVSQGNQLGRTIGYPTANIVVNNDLVLKHGVYITKILLPNTQEWIKGISAYWTNKNGVSVFETHIFNFDQDIYGWGIEIEILHYIRENIKAKDMNHVKELLNSDKTYANKWFEENK